MNKKIILIIFFFFLIILQQSFLTNLVAYNLTPNLSLIVIIIWSAKKSLRSVWFWAIVAGFMLDIFSLNWIGLNMISFLLVALAVDFLSRKLLTDNEITDFFIIMLMTVLGVLFADFLKIIFFQANNFSLGIGVDVFWKTLSMKKATIYLLNNLLAFGFIYGCQKKIENIFYNEKKIIV